MTQTGQNPWTIYRNRTLYDVDGQRIGSIEEIYVDDASGRAEWALIHTGLFGSKQTFVPLQGAAATDGGDLRTPLRQEDARNAPRIEADEQLSEQEERRLFEYYGVPYTTEGSTTTRDDETGARTGSTGGTSGRSEPTTDDDRASGATGRDVSGPTTDEAMTRSEEELRVGIENRERGRARLRKYVVTEEQTLTVPVQREEVRLEREPITEENVGAATDGPAISEEEHEVVLHEERPVVEKQTVAKERVRLGTETTRDEVQVSEEVRKEQIEMEGDDDTGGHGSDRRA